MKILIADDEKDIRNMIKLYLQAEDYEILEAENGQEVLSLIDNMIDLVILDIMMPKLDGIQVCMKIREKYRMPIIFLTAKTEDVDKLTGFSSGGDDYIVKPFNPIDLVSRVKANIRRYRSYSQSPSEQENSQKITLGELSVDLNSRTVYKYGNEITLTKTEFAIFALLLQNKGKVYSLEQIYTTVWNENCILNSESTVSVHIKNLREKIEENVREPRYIKTVWGVGYRVD